MASMSGRGFDSRHLHHTSHKAPCGEAKKSSVDRSVVSHEALAKWGLFNYFKIYLELIMYVYILRSKNFSKKIYIGKTLNISERLQAHNEGKNFSTKMYRPWKIVWFGWFETEILASNFERYLKTGSGFAFRNKRLVEL